MVIAVSLSVATSVITPVVTPVITPVITPVVAVGGVTGWAKHLDFSGLSECHGDTGVDPTSGATGRSRKCSRQHLVAPNPTFGLASVASGTW